MPNVIQQLIFDKMSLPRLERALDLTTKRQQLLAENVANAETVGYRRRDIDFGRELSSAMKNVSSRGMKTTRAGHIGGSSGKAGIRIDTVAGPRKGESTVQLDQEMAHLARNQLEFNITAHLARNKFEGLKTAIRGGR